MKEKKVEKKDKKKDRTYKKKEAGKMCNVAAFHVSEKKERGANGGERREMRDK